MDDNLINRVASSALITIDLEQYYPTEEIVNFDLKDFLYMDMILKELDFRKALKELDWSIYKDKIVTICCSNNAIVPIWANMLVSSYLENVAIDAHYGSKENYLSYHYKSILTNMDVSQYRDKMIVIKGCSNKVVPVQAYVTLMSKLRPIAKSIMFGEPCSTVPLFKKPRK